MFVPVIAVGGVAVTVVDIVDMVIVLNRLMAAVGSMLMVVTGVGHAGTVAITLIPVVAVRTVPVTVVDVVDVVAVRDRGVPAVGAVLMIVIGVRPMLNVG